MITGKHFPRKMLLTFVWEPQRLTNLTHWPQILVISLIYTTKPAISRTEQQLQAFKSHSGQSSPNKLLLSHGAVVVVIPFVTRSGNNARDPSRRSSLTLQSFKSGKHLLVNNYINWWQVRKRTKRSIDLFRYYMTGWIERRNVVVVVVVQNNVLNYPRPNRTIEPTNERGIG